MSKRKSLLVVAFLLLGLLLAACQPAVQEVTRVVESEVTRVVTEEVEVPGGQVEVTRVVTEVVEVPAEEEEEAAPEEPVTRRGYDTTDIPSLDPQVAEDAVSITYIENLFVHLTNYDLDTAEVVPDAATSWEVSEDGLVYTFHLRTDIPWVYHNPV
ncbi:MAG: hypothetical protein L0322_03115, partial [Chloroflexi bacterium]|nr:hypothetical protein [Chloroflexota bacterium]